MKLGVCSSDFNDMSADALFQKAADFGFSAMQLAFSSVTDADCTATGQIEIPDAVNPAAIKAIRTASDACGVEIAAVNGTFNMTHPDPEIRAEGVRRFSGFAEAVAALDVPFVSLCTGTRYAPHLWRPHPDNTTPEAWADMMDTMRRVVEIAERLNLTLAVETEAANVIDSAEKARKMMDDIGSEKLKMIIDCANLFHAGMAKPENVRPVIGNAFDVFGRDIVLAHGKDIAAGDGIDFCPTGRGIIDYPFFVERLNACGYAGPMLLHGVYDDDAMVEAAALMRALL